MQFQAVNVDMVPQLSSSRPVLLTFPAVQLEVWYQPQPGVPAAPRARDYPTSVLSYWLGAGEEPRKWWKVVVPPSASCRLLPTPPTHPRLPLQPRREAQAAWLLCHRGTRPHLVSISKHKQLPGAAGQTDLVTKCTKSIIASVFKYAPFHYLRCQFSYMEKVEIMYMGALTMCW